MYGISDAGINLIKSFEGLKLFAYQDSVGVWTVGYGHTLSAHKGLVITKDRAVELLKLDIMRFEYVVNREVLVPLTQWQYDAIISLTFNIGSGAFMRSTLLKKVNAGEYAQAADEFLKWNRAGKKVLEGLTNRRVAERNVFLGLGDPRYTT